MYRRVFLLAFVPVWLALLAGCSKDYITNEITEVATDTGIIGRVIPAEPGIRVSAWQATMKAEVTADDSGYFAILGLTSGLYDVRARTTGGDTASVTNIKVSKGYTSAVLVRLDGSVLPYLILGYSPTDGATGIDPSKVSIRLTTREPLDVGSMSSSIAIDPPLAGHWSDDSYIVIPVPQVPEGTVIPDSTAVVRASVYYTFVNDAPFVPATQYTVRILPSLRLEDGTEWGDSLTFSFTIDSLRVTCLRTSSGHCGDTVMGLQTFVMVLGFNSDVNLDSLDLAASFSPAIEGFWYYPDYYTGRKDYAQFFYTAPPPLRAEQTFTLTIAGNVGLSGPVGLGADYVAHLVTEPVRVVRILPPKGADASVGTWVEVDFNTAMDYPSTEASVTVREMGGAPVACDKVWLDEYKLTFRPSSSLLLGQAYEVLVANTAQSLAGDTLRDSAYSFFRASY